MSASITIKGPNGQDVPLGEVSDPIFTQAIQASPGRSQLQALEVDFLRNLGQNHNDPADDVVFKLQAGAGHGEVQETTATIQLKNSRNQTTFGTLTLSKVCVSSYQEKDLGASIQAHIVLRASSYHYQPADGQQVEVNIRPKKD
jgi:hypothetical protein